MRTLKFTANSATDTYLIERFDGLVGITGSRLIATNINNVVSTITGGAVVQGNAVHIFIPASYNVDTNYPAKFLVEVTTDNTNWTGILELRGSLRAAAAVGSPTTAMPVFSPGQTIGTCYSKPNTALTYGAAATLIAGTTLVVPPSTRDVWLVWGAHIGVSTGGQGAIITKAYEITGGVATYLEATVTYCVPSQPVTSLAGVQLGRTRVGPSSITRIFQLYGQTVQEAGSGLVGYSRNLSGLVGSTWLSAVAQ